MTCTLQKVRLRYGEGAWLLRGDQSLVTVRNRPGITAAIDYCDAVIRNCLRLPPDALRVTLMAYNGLTAAAVARGLHNAGRTMEVQAVAIDGIDRVRRTLTSWCPQWRTLPLTIRDAGLPVDVLPQVTSFGNVELAPLGDAKALPFVRGGDVFWLQGSVIFDA